MGRFLAFLLGAAGALLGSQGPGFTLQYMQNLQGRIDELRPIVEQYDANVAAQGYTRAQALVECKDATALLDALCEGYETTIIRFEKLTAHMAELESATDLVRPLILARTQMEEVTRSTYDQFEPAIPATINGAAYAAGGFVLLWGVASFFFGALGALFGTSRRYG